MNKLQQKEKGAGFDNTWLVLASLFFSGSPVKGRTRFQKTIFLLKEVYGIPFDFDFKPYYYGPYSEQLSNAVSLLTALKLVEEHAEYLGMGITRYHYQITEKGKRYSEILQKSVKGDTLKTLRKLRNGVAEIGKLKTPELISKAKSLIRNQQVQ